MKIQELKEESKEKYAARKERHTIERELLSVAKELNLNGSLLKKMDADGDVELIIAVNSEKDPRMLWWDHVPVSCATQFKFSLEIADRIGIPKSGGGGPELLTRVRKIIQRQFALGKRIGELKKKLALTFKKPQEQETQTNEGIGITSKERSNRPSINRLWHRMVVEIISRPS